MKHQQEEEKSYDFVYYLLGLVTGVFTGAILDVGMIWALVGGVLGLLSAGLFLNVLVKGREEA
ncbi:hypothetical protein HDF19_04880 [Mucilaginibacter sp. E4BP6]|jgi:hypothetical protein|uniref:hypothetical protein n=1 Tax=Mucilaginibacter sp. E4BP6 TaxID=2723089 RepID=UPI0015C8E366|nr:hypothetical protein [Mucilaginibacter sp. E4BP6]NYE64813.1 hypothetical protein [Mucilaginibacter sp. E4BP6]